MTEKIRYRVLIENRALAGWQRLFEKYPDKMTTFQEFLKNQPTNTRITNGEVKKLKGRLDGILQYDISYSERIRYEVDKRSHIVSVLYAGEHP